MMIVRVTSSASDIMLMQLTHLNVKVDPRPIGFDEGDEHEFSFSVNGRTLTITRIDQDYEDDGWDCIFSLRV